MFLFFFLGQPGGPSLEKGQDPFGGKKAFCCFFSPRGLGGTGLLPKKKSGRPTSKILSAAFFLNPLLPFGAIFFFLQKGRGGGGGTGAIFLHWRGDKGKNGKRFWGQKKGGFCPKKKKMGKKNKKKKKKNLGQDGGGPPGGASGIDFLDLGPRNSGAICGKNPFGGSKKKKKKKKPNGLFPKNPLRYELFVRFYGFRHVF